MRRSVPDPWATAMTDAGFTDPRYNDPRPSMARLADRVGVHTSTITSMIFGERATDQATLEAVAAALGVPASEVAGWLGRQDPNPYAPPSAASLLTQEEREHVDWMIRRLTRDRLAPAKPDDDAPETAERLPDVRRELRALQSRHRELVESGRPLSADERDLLELWETKIRELKTRLTRPAAGGGHAEQTGS